MRILFFGTSEFAVPALDKLIASDYEVVGVVTQPDKPVGRKQELQPSAVKIFALEKGLSVFQPEMLEIESWKLEIPEAELYIVVSYGQIIPKPIFDFPKYGTINIHPSLLPKYRGPSPIQETILNGDENTGVTIIKVDAEMDHGPILASAKFKIPNSRNSYRKLHDDLARLGAQLLVKVLPEYISGELKLKEQEHSKATFTKMISKDDGRIDWSESAEKINQMIRAYSVWPVVWTTFEKKRLKIFKALVRTDVRTRVRTNGELYIEDGKLYVACGDGSDLQILELQLEGKQKMNSKEFINGMRDKDGKKLV